jgi:DNA-directed RNA polymerase subunit RPC12/RpoP
MTYLECLKAGHDYKGAKSIVENYCVKCLQHVPEDKSTWTNDGNECEECSSC